MIFFVTFGMLVGAICRAISKKTKFPYTPILLMVGIGLGYFRNYLSTVGEGAEIIAGMDPHMILLTFLPILMFESAFNCDWYVFKKEIVNILLLAGPGALWGAVLIACCFKYILGYDELSWNEALTMGCMLSTTDPVAVVALLKELGASVRFNTLIEGESLLNDGTAMVFFMVFLNMVKGNTQSLTSVITNFIRMGLGGPLLGLGIGLIATYYLKKVVRDDIMTANIIFVACYLSFYFAENTFLKVNSMLAIVVLGLYLSAMARTRIHPESEHSLHAVWAYAQYICETTIFILTGIIIAVQLIEKSTITPSDWIKLFIFFILLNICRLLMVLTLLPILRSFGYGVTMKEFVVIVYGGIRGAVGLCFALLVSSDEQLNHRFR
jgi:NhaP-type Na+/H+ or K+/H+ antiporter